ncbi:MAG TPA: 50S ribosomal protein L11 methyltransferase [Verrucomicrobiae bacterium]|nr:50S ribosomal protein L11 methyltransferase [Verrucomicrobiae bacterium]
MSCYTPPEMQIEGYSLSGYGEMIADRVRTGAYLEALRAVIRPGAVVMDIGTGPGIMAVQACQLGAKHVYAIEPGEVIQLAREIAAANHCADKIEFFEDISTNVTIPTRADVIVSDLRGILPFYSDHIPSIADARLRFLAPGGTLIGREDRVWAAVVEAPERFSKIVDPWTRDLPGQDLSPARRKVVNEIHRMQAAPELLLTSPNLWVALDYTCIENPDAQGELTSTVKREGTGHGIVIWFDADLADGVGFSNRPGSATVIYSSMFLPWPEPVLLVAGQTVCVHLQAKLVEEDYFWRWTTRIECAGQPGKIVAEFDQSVLQGAVLSPAKLLKRSSKYVPHLSEEGLMRRRALELMDGRVALEEIARRLTAEFPGKFARWEQALTFAGAISNENSR